MDAALHKDKEFKTQVSPSLSDRKKKKSAENEAQKTTMQKSTYGCPLSKPRIEKY